MSLLSTDQLAVIEAASRPEGNLIFDWPGRLFVVEGPPRFQDYLFVRIEDAAPASASFASPGPPPAARSYTQTRLAVRQLYFNFRLAAAWAYVPERRLGDINLFMRAVIDCQKAYSWFDLWPSSRYAARSRGALATVLSRLPAPTRCPCGNPACTVDDDPAAALHAERMRRVQEASDATWALTVPIEPPPPPAPAPAASPFVMTTAEMMGRRLEPKPLQTETEKPRALSGLSTAAVLRERLEVAERQALPWRAVLGVDWGYSPPVSVDMKFQVSLDGAVWFDVPSGSSPADFPFNQWVEAKR